MSILIVTGFIALSLALITLVEARHDSRGDAPAPSSHHVDRDFLPPAQRR